MPNYGISSLVSHMLDLTVSDEAKIFLYLTYGSHPLEALLLKTHNFVSAHGLILCVKRVKHTPVHLNLK